MKKLFTIILIFISFATLAQNENAKIYTSDITNFWTAYDSVLTTKNEIKQIYFIQTLYVEKASAGLKDFIQLRNFTSEEWAKDINQCPKFWTSIRSKTLAIQAQTVLLEHLMERFKELYPSFKRPDIYFAIGCLRSGGTTTIDKILIGAEIAAADSSIDASELGKWLQGVFKVNKGIDQLVAHEAGHTQQIEEGDDIELLGECLREGSCDFISEMLLEKSYNAPYMIYGKENEALIFKKFQKQKFGNKTSDWLSNGDNAPGGHADLGYFIGYIICKSYFDKSMDKAKALTEIIKLNYENNKDIRTFYEKTSYNGKEKKTDNNLNKR